MALHATAILSTSRACMDIPPELTTPPGTTPTPAGNSASAEKKTPTVEKGQKKTQSTKSEGHQVMSLTPCPGNQYFRPFMVELLKIFDQDKSLFEKKGSFIVR